MPLVKRLKEEDPARMPLGVVWKATQFTMAVPFIPSPDSIMQRPKLRPVTAFVHTTAESCTPDGLLPWLTDASTRTFPDPEKL